MDKLFFLFGIFITQLSLANAPAGQPTELACTLQVSQSGCGAAFHPCVPLEPPPGPVQTLAPIKLQHVEVGDGKSELTGVITYNLTLGTQSYGITATGVVQLDEGETSSSQVTIAADDGKGNTTSSMDSLKLTRIEYSKSTPPYVTANLRVAIFNCRLE